MNKMKITYNVITNYFYCTNQLSEDLANDYVEQNIRWAYMLTLFMGIVSVVTICLVLYAVLSEKKYLRDLYLLLFAVFFFWFIVSATMYYRASKDIFSFLC